MARKKVTTNPPPPSSDEKEASVQNDAVKEVKLGELETPVQKYRESVSDPEDDYSENTAPSPNVSDFIIKPIVGKTSKSKKPSSKRFAFSEPSGTHSKKVKFDPPPFVVLGLPNQGNKLDLRKQVDKQSRKKKSDSKAKEKVNSKIDSKRLSELLRKEMMLKLLMGNELPALDVGMRVIGGDEVKEIEEKWRRLQQQMLELYIKRLELVQEQTKLVLDKLKSSEV